MKDILERIEKKLDMLLDDRKMESAHASSTPKEYKDVDKEWFRATCRTLLASPKLTDDKFRGALQDFPKTVDRYGRLTSGQWKFFGVIHNNILGTWPKEPKPGEKAPAPRAYSAEELDGIPF